MSVCPSGWNDWTPTGRIFVKFYIWVFLENLSRKIQVSLKSNQNNGYFAWRPIFFLIIYHSVLIRIKNVADKLCSENQNAFYVKWLFFSKNHAAYEMMWSNTVEPVRPQMTIGTCSLHAGYLRLQRPSEYVICILVYSVFIKLIVTFLIFTTRYNNKNACVLRHS